MATIAKAKALAMPSRLTAFGPVTAYDRRPAAEKHEGERSDEFRNQFVPGRRLLGVLPRILSDLRARAASLKASISKRYPSSA
jgi:hypothetical protein